MCVGGGGAYKGGWGGLGLGLEAREHLAFVGHLTVGTRPME